MSQHPATRLPNTVKDDLTPEPPTEQAPTRGVQGGKKRPMRQ